MYSFKEIEKKWQKVWSETKVKKNFKKQWVSNINYWQMAFKKGANWLRLLQGSSWTRFI